MHLQESYRLDPKNQSTLYSLQIALGENGNAEEAARIKRQLAGLLRKVGPNGDLKAEFRRRRARVREERDRGVARILEGLSRARG